MRATLIALLLISLAVAPVVAGWPDACEHEAPAMAADAGHEMHATMSMDAENDAEAPCHCDPGCAEHCDAAASAALIGVDRPDAPVAIATPAAAVVRSLHDGPPRVAPLRPPQPRTS